MTLFYLLACGVCRVEQSELKGWYKLTQESNEGSCPDFTRAILDDFRIEGGKPIIFEEAYGAWCDKGSSTWNSEECSNTHNWSCDMGEPFGFPNPIHFSNSWVVTTGPRDTDLITVELYMLSVFSDGTVDCESNYVFTGVKHGNN